jgi:hypothetical protein
LKDTQLVWTLDLDFGFYLGFGSWFFGYWTVAVSINDITKVALTFFLHKRTIAPFPAFRIYRNLRKNPMLWLWVLRLH